MRETLERAVGKKIKVAAILLTHWHYADGTGAWLDEGTEVWGHGHLGRNRSAAGGTSVLGGVLQSNMIAQFRVFHPTTGPDAFPNLLSFPPEKFLAVSSYQPPTKLFPDGKGAPARGGDALAELDRVLDRGRMLPPGAAVPAVLDAKGDLKYNDGLEH